MMKYNEWKLITESLGGMTLGMSRPNVIGGVVGSHFNEDDKETDADVEDDGEFDDDDSDDEGEDDSLEGDLTGASEEEGVDKGFPPDDSEEMGEKEPVSDGEGEGDLEDAMAQLGDAPEGDDDLSAALGSPNTNKATDGSGEGDMDFLNDIDPALLGGEDGSDVAPAMGDDAAADVGGDDASGSEVPCPDCNPDGANDQGQDGCPGCDGSGFTGGDDLAGDDLAGDVQIDPDHHKDTKDLMAMMASYMGKYMHKEGAVDAEPAQLKQESAKPARRSEAKDFFASLASQTGSANMKFKSGLSEDVLFPSNGDEDSRPGQVGYAPQGRIGGIGGGYTKADFADIPTLGESKRKFPTLNEWVAAKNKKLGN